MRHLVIGIGLAAAFVWGFERGKVAGIKATAEAFIEMMDKPASKLIDI